MEPWLTQIRNTLLSDKTPRVFLLGTTAVLFLIVIIDLFGARARAPEVRETMRMVAAEAPAATVPSVYRVPRDLASARGGEAPQTQVVQPADDLPMEAPESAMAEAEIEEDIPQETPVETVAETADDTASEAELADSEPQAQAEDMAEAEPATEPAAMVAAEENGAATGLALLASADITKGQSIWRQCAACHIYDSEQNRGGPYLVNIIGREIGAAEGWRYSRALSEHGGVWTVEGLLAWLENPDAYIPGNQMAFRGLRNEQDRIDLLGFLNANRIE